jgi:hypothetical protein
VLYTEPLLSPPGASLLLSLTRGSGVEIEGEAKGIEVAVREVAVKGDLACGFRQSTGGGWSNEDQAARRERLRSDKTCIQPFAFTLSR